MSGPKRNQRDFSGDCKYTQWGRFLRTEQHTRKQFLRLTQAYDWDKLIFEVSILPTCIIWVVIQKNFTCHILLKELSLFSKTYLSIGVRKTAFSGQTSPKKKGDQRYALISKQTY